MTSDHVITGTVSKKLFERKPTVRPRNRLPATSAYTSSSRAGTTSATGPSSKVLRRVSAPQKSTSDGVVGVADNVANLRQSRRTTAKGNRSRAAGICWAPV